MARAGAENEDDANKNGIQEKEADGRLLETDPLAKDCDVDGITDGPEVTGFWCYAGQSAPCPSNGVLNPMIPDYDKDGLRDGQEAAGWRVGIWFERTMEKKVDYQVVSSPLVADADGDQMNDFAEFLNGSDPGKDDTDGDGIKDKAEVDGGYNITGIEGTPPAITNVKNYIEVQCIQIWFICIPTSANVKVEFDLADNVGIDKVVIKVKRFFGLVTETRAVQLPAAPNNKQGHVGETFGFSLLEAIGSGADVNISAYDVNGNGAWGDFHIDSLFEAIAKAILAFFAAIAKIIVEAISALANLIISMISSGFESLLQGLKGLAEPLLKSILPALVEAGGARAGEPLLAIAVIIAAPILFLTQQFQAFFLLGEALECVLTAPLLVMSGGLIAIIKGAAAKTIKDKVISVMIGMVAVATGLAFLETILEGYNPDALENIYGTVFKATIGITLLVGIGVEIIKVIKETGELEAKAKAVAFAIVGLLLEIFGGDMLAALGMSPTGPALGLVEFLALAAALFGIYLQTKGKRSIMRQLRGLCICMVDFVEDAVTVTSVLDTGFTFFYGVRDGKYLPGANP